MRFTWTFGDGTPLATDRAPLHTYLLPGSYEVDLVGAFGGANTVASKAVVDVKARDVGQPCDLDLQCAGGLRCACAPGTGCSPAFLRGLCSTPCDSVACDLGVCAALALAPAPAADGGPAVLPWCVEGCQTSADCAPGFRCETLAAAGVAGPGTWTRGCLPIGALGDIGATCRDATGALADTACATGSCIDLGALGTCSATCDGDRTCPDKTACALMPDGRRLCLVDCNAPGASCARDPLLACVAPMNATPPSADGGATGFRADGGAGASYCAPKPCASDTDCAPAGLCGPGAQCVR
jgi:PKD repeat protein